MRFDSGRGRALERSESSTSREKGEGGEGAGGGKKAEKGQDTDFVSGSRYTLARHIYTIEDRVHVSAPNSTVR